MNKKFFRNKFNAARGEYMAVSEMAKSCVRGGQQNADQVIAGLDSSSKTPVATALLPEEQRGNFQLKLLVTALSSLVAFSPVMPVYAKIVADPKAPAANRPTITQPGNTPIVDIQTPKGGVSRNIYSQFDVGANGAVLNNSAAQSQSKIAGSVAGNKWLSATGGARTIVNEVTGANASQISGAIEVVGMSRANVVFANPNGITINGGEFININKATLTTGAIQYKPTGEIDKFNVKQGIVTINPNADARKGGLVNPQYTEILARAVEINAKLQGTQTARTPADGINIVTGSNEISVNLDEIKATSGTGTAPTLALDVAELGGLYAQNIFMVGTEKGLGVNNSGTIRGWKNLSLTNEGKIVNNGTGIIQTWTSDAGTLGLTTKNNQLTSESGDIVNNGSILANGMIYIDAGRNLILNKNSKTGQDTVYSKTSPAILNAGNDIILDQARVTQSAAEQILSLNAGGNIELKNNSEINSGNNVYLSSIGVTTVDNSKILINNNNAGNLNIVSQDDLNIINNSEIKSSNALLNIVSQGKSNKNTNLTIQNSNIDAGADINWGASGNINVDNVNFFKEENQIPVRANNIKIQAGENLIFSNTLGSSSPQTTGFIKMFAGGDTTIKADGILKAGTGLTIGGNNVNVQTIGLNTTGGDLTVAANKNLDLRNMTVTANNGNLNITASDGYANLAYLTLKSQNNNISLLSKENLDLISVSLNSGKDLVIATTGNQGNINYKNNSFGAVNGNIRIDSKADLNISSLYEGLSFLRLSGQKLQLSAANNLVLDSVVLSSKENMVLHADKDVLLNTKLSGMSNELGWNGALGRGIVYSDKHLAISSKDGAIKIGTQGAQHLTMETTLTAGGVTSIKSKLDQNHYNTLINSGAVTLHSDAGSIKSDNLSVNAKKTTFLESDNALKKINGNLSLYTKKDIELNANNELRRDYYGNITRSIKPVLSSQGVMDIRADGVFQVKGKAPPVQQTEMWNQIPLDRAYLTSDNGMNVLAGTVKLYAADLKNKSTTAPMSITSSTGDIVLDAMSYDVNTGQLDLISTIQNRRDQLEASGKKDAATLNEIQQLNGEIGFYLSRDLNGVRHRSSYIDSAQDINLVSKKGILVRASELNAKGNVNLEAQGLLAKDQTGAQASDYIDTSILVDGVHDIYKNGVSTNPNYEERSDFYNSVISGDKGVNIKSTGSAQLNWFDNPALLPNYATVSSAAPIQLKRKLNDGKHNIVLNGAELISSGGDVNIQSNANIVMESSLDEIYKHNTSQVIKKYWYGRKKSTETYSQSQIGTAVPTTILAKNINLKASGDMDFYSTLMNANGGKVNITGENLYFLASNNHASSNTTTKKSSSIFGIPLNKSKTTSSRSQISQLPVKLVGDYLSTESKNDTVFVGTDFNYLKDATVKAGGQIAFLGASDTIRQQTTKTQNNIAWQSMQDKGSISESAKLPSFNGPNPPKFEAEGGLVVQVPYKDELRTELENLINQQGTTYLRDLTLRNDVNWQAVKLAQENWDYKSQGLTPEMAALIVIIITVVTYGYGAQGAGAALFGTTNATTAAMANAAVASMASQAAISLANNGGDPLKALKSLGDSDYIKRLAVSVLTAGALDAVGGTDWMLKLKGMGGDPDFLVNIAGRTGMALIEAGVSAGISTSVNGGSLTESLQNALLFNIANALHGSLASEIGQEFNISDKSFLQNLLHKVAHLAAACATGSILNQCESSAIGAGIGEFVAEFMPAASGNGVYTDAEKEKILAVGKILSGSIAGIIGYDVTAASGAANTALVNNALSKTEVDVLAQKLKSCQTETQCITEIRKAVLKSNYNASNGQNCTSLCASNLDEAIVGYNQLRAFIASGKFSGAQLAQLNKLLNSAKDDISFQINRLPQVQAYLSTPWTPPTRQEIAQVVIDVFPITSDASAIYSVITGKTVFTQEEVSRFYSAIGIIIPIAAGRSLTKAEIAQLRQTANSPFDVSISAKDLPLLPVSAQRYMAEKIALDKSNSLLQSAKNDPKLSTWSNKQIGDKGEEIAVQFVKGSGYTDVISIQNASGNGIDIIAKTPQGDFAFFEVKTSAVGKVGNLSKRQENMSFFINDVLGQASSGSGRYANISKEMQANAAIMHKELQKIEELNKKTPGAKVIISGSAVGIDLKNGNMRVSKW